MKRSAESNKESGYTTKKLFLFRNSLGSVHLLTKCFGIQKIL